MEKKKKQMIMIGVLVPILGFVAYNSYQTVSERKTKKPARTVAEPAPAAAPVAGVVVPRVDQGGPAVADEKLLGMQETIAAGPWERNPFQAPPVEKEGQVSEDWKSFALSGIISGRLAIINGEPVGVGEEYQGYRLKQVDQYQIILEKDDQSFILTLSEE